MNAKQIVKQLISDTGSSTYKIATQLGKTQSHITGYLNRGNTDIRVDTFNELVNAMGYKIVVVPKDCYIDEPHYEIQKSI